MSDFPKYEIEIINNGFIVRQSGGITFVPKFSDAVSLISCEIEDWNKRQQHSDRAVL